MQHSRRSAAPERKAGGNYISNIMLSEYFRFMKPEDQSRWLSYFSRIIPELDHHHIAACVQNLALGVSLLTAINREALVTFVEVLYCHGGRCSSLMPRITDGLNIVPPYVESNNIGFNNNGFNNNGFNNNGFNNNGSNNNGVAAGRGTAAIVSENARGSSRQIEKSSRNASGDFENKPWRCAGIRNILISPLPKDSLVHDDQNCEATKEIQSAMRELRYRALKFIADFVLPDKPQPRSPFGAYGSASDSASSSTQNSGVINAVNDTVYRRFVVAESERFGWAASSTWNASSRNRENATETWSKSMTPWSSHQPTLDRNARKLGMRGVGKAQQRIWAPIERGGSETPTEKEERKPYAAVEHKGTGRDEHIVEAKVEQNQVAALSAEVGLDAVQKAEAKSEANIDAELRDGILKLDVEAIRAQSVETH